MARELDNLSGKLSPENRSGEHMGSAAMSYELDWNFADSNEAKTDIRAAVGYLLRGATGSARGDIVREIIEIVRDVANGEQSDPLDDGLPGG
jgi:hypothetical protein